MCIIILEYVGVYSVKEYNKQLRRGPISLFYANIGQKLEPFIHILPLNNAFRQNIHVSNNLNQVLRQL
jgi:hypothetical protein